MEGQEAPVCGQGFGRKSLVCVLRITQALPVTQKPLMSRAVAVTWAPPPSCKAQQAVKILKALSMDAHSMGLMCLVELMEGLPAEQAHLEWMQVSQTRLHTPMQSQQMQPHAHQARAAALHQAARLAGQSAAQRAKHGPGREWFLGKPEGFWNEQAHASLTSWRFLRHISCKQRQFALRQMSALTELSLEAGNYGSAGPLVYQEGMNHGAKHHSSL